MSTLPYNTITSTTSVYPPADHGRQVRQHSSTHFPGPITCTKWKKVPYPKPGFPWPSPIWLPPPPQSSPAKGVALNTPHRIERTCPLIGWWVNVGKNPRITVQLPNQDSLSPTWVSTNLSAVKRGGKKTMMLGKGDAAAHQSGGDSLLHTCMGSHFELSK